MFDFSGKNLIAYLNSRGMDRKLWFYFRSGGRIDTNFKNT